MHDAPFRDLEADMANCVSCGREIEPGSLFCDQCYAKMKGRRGPLRDIAGTAAGKQDAGRPAGAAEEGAAPPPAAAARRASGYLTPADQKKVVSIRPDLDKNAKEKHGRSKKRFTITITFSERTYQMLYRLSRRKGGKEAGVTAAGGEEKAPAPAESKPARRRKGLYGRPALTAVGGGKVAGYEGRTKAVGLKGWIAHRERKWDRRDYGALALGAAAGVLILALSFLGWLRVSWGAAEGPSFYDVSIKGIDLGALAYLIIALDVAAFLYIPAARLLGRRLRHLDFGVVLLLAGILIIIIFYAAIAPNDRIMDIAYRLAEQRGLVPAGELAQRETLASAYLMALLGVLMAFSGLVRLSERRETGKAGGGVA